MSTKRYPAEFKIEAVKQVTERGHTVADVASRLGVSTHSLYKWINEAKLLAEVHLSQLTQAEDLRRLKAELKRVTEEHNILKKAAAYLVKQSGSGGRSSNSPWISFLGRAGAVCLTQHGSHLLFGELTLSRGLLAGWESSSQGSVARRSWTGQCCGMLPNLFASSGRGFAPCPW